MKVTAPVKIECFGSSLALIPRECGGHVRYKEDVGHRTAADNLSDRGGNIGNGPSRLGPNLICNETS